MVSLSLEATIRRYTKYQNTYSKLHPFQNDFIYIIHINHICCFNRHVKIKAMHQCPSIPENKGQVIYYCTNHVGVFFPAESLIVHDIFPLNLTMCFVPILAGLMSSALDYKHVNFDISFDI